MELIRLPGGRFINMARVTEACDLGQGTDLRLRVHFGQGDTTDLGGADRVALLRYLGQVARDVSLEEHHDWGLTAREARELAREEVMAPLPGQAPDDPDEPIPF